MFDVKFIEAIAYGLTRNYVLGDEYYNVMTPIQRKKTVSIAGLGQIEQVRHVMDEVRNSIDGGGTFAQFQKAVADGKVNVNLPEYRLANIFRTNIQSGYNHGKWQQQQRTKAYRPYLMYDAINDSRTRPHHLALDEVIRHIDDPWWLTHYTPNGYQCRCSTRSLTKKQAEAKGITTDDDLPEVGPDSADWGQSPSNYAEIMEQRVNRRIAEVTIEYFKNRAVGEALQIAAVRFTHAATELLESPIPSLAAYLAEAQKLIDDADDLP